jgi:hypothetical protein
MSVKEARRAGVNTDCGQYADSKEKTKTWPHELFELAPGEQKSLAAIEVLSRDEIWRVPK